jgi:hypothetical protein
MYRWRWQQPRLTSRSPRVEHINDRSPGTVTRTAVSAYSVFFSMHGADTQAVMLRMLGASADRCLGRARSLCGFSRRLSVGGKCLAPDSS